MQTHRPQAQRRGGKRLYESHQTGTCQCLKQIQIFLNAGREKAASILPVSSVGEHNLPVLTAVTQHAYIFFSLVVGSWEC